MATPFDFVVAPAGPPAASHYDLSLLPRTALVPIAIAAFVLVAVGATIARRRRPWLSKVRLQFVLVARNSRASQFGPPTALVPRHATSFSRSTAGSSGRTKDWGCRPRRGGTRC
jgi:hypothetical protein